MKKKQILPPRFLQASLLLIMILHYSFPVVELYSWPTRLIGLIPVILGSILNIKTDKLIRENNTTIKPHIMPTQLIVTGPFRFSRNPIYLGMALIVLGGTLFSGTLTAFVFPITFVVIIHVKYIKTEEAILEDTFGEPYLNYKKRVRRWI